MRILHVMRSPVGGLFRHVCDLAREQSRLGHEIGIIADSTTGGDAANHQLKACAEHCTLGIERIAMPRLPGPADIKNTIHVSQKAKSLGVDIIHAHGAKGGLYGRLAAKMSGAKSVYSPHGGSLHFSWSQPSGAIFLLMEKLLKRAGSNFVFVCQFERGLFDQKIGLGTGNSKVVQNGLTPEEFLPSTLANDATNLLFVGEMRHLKGVDTLLDAMALMPNQSLTLVGEGQDRSRFEQQSEKLGLAHRVRFVGRKNFRDALQLGKIIIMPSRHEAFPYVILESLAAKRIVLASSVGGIPEILPRELLFQPDTPQSLVAKLRQIEGNNSHFTTLIAATHGRLQHNNTTKAMAVSILEFYNTLQLKTGR